MCKELDMSVEIVGCEAVRDRDGLVLSSRNSYLNENNRLTATVLYKTLTCLKRIIKEKQVTEFKILKKSADNILSSVLSFELDYLYLVDKKTLKIQKKSDKNSILLMAGYINKVRLIDNIEIYP